jgi:hypothetical protein
LVQIKASNLGLQVIFQAVKGLKSDNLKGLYELKQAQTTIYIFSPMILWVFWIAPGIMEGLKDPPGKQRPGSQLGVLKSQWTYILVIFSETKKATGKPISVLDSA